MQLAKFGYVLFGKWTVRRGKIVGAYLDTVTLEFNGVREVYNKRNVFATHKAAEQALMKIVSYKSHI